jgi:hypothetical protein
MGRAPGNCPIAPTATDRELHADLGVIRIERLGAALAGTRDVTQRGSPGIEREQQLACPDSSPAAGRRIQDSATWPARPPDAFRTGLPVSMHWA